MSRRLSRPAEGVGEGGIGGGGAMSRRLLLSALLGLVPAGCGRRGRLRLPEREDGTTAPTPPPEPARPTSRRRPTGPIGLETG